MEPKGVDMACKVKIISSKKPGVSIYARMHERLDPNVRRVDSKGVMQAHMYARASHLGVVVLGSLGDVSLLIGLLGLSRGLSDERVNDLVNLARDGLLRAKRLLAGGLVETLDEGEESG